MGFCTKCGKPLQLDAAFCPSCGVRRNTTSAPIPAKPKTRATVIVVWIVIGLVGLGVLGALNSPDKTKSSDGSEPATDSGNSSSPASASPDMTVTAAQIVADYTANEVSADEKYKGRRIQVVGAVDSISKDLFNHPFVTVGNGEDFEITVQCSLRGDQEANAAKLGKGESVTVQGHCNGKLMNVQLDDCVIIAAGG